MNDEQTPALREAVENMTNMREAYDNLSQAAEAYNTGKAELAQNITAKGVEASADETLPELAEKVAAISQETYEINGGEMYAKQLFGSLETPNYWNLYDVLTQLLSDGRLVQYGGILLAEYYRGYDSLALAGAGAGGAYVVSDKDEQGNFKMYTEDTTHTWATEFDGKGNRWVAYCFADEYHDFQITDTNTSPRSIFIGRKVGTITSLVNSRCSQVVVPDGSELNIFNANSKSHNFGKNVIIQNVKSFLGLATTEANECFFIDLHPNVILDSVILSIQSAVACIMLNLNGGSIRKLGYYGIFTGGRSYTIPLFIAHSITKIEGTIWGGFPAPTIKKAIISAEEIDTTLYSTFAYTNIYEIEIYSEYIHGTNVMIYGATDLISVKLGYITNDPNKSIKLCFSGSNSNYSFELIQDDWLKSLDISGMNQSLSAEEIAINILAKLGTCTSETGTLTLKLGSTNLSTIQNSEEYSSYLTDAIDNKNWNVIA